MNNFRSVSFWKTAVMTLPDNAFFELIRVVFGKIKTPFNKQILSGDLEKFLTRNDIQENIAAYISDDDRRIIAAVAALDEPPPEDLETFFAGDPGGGVLHDLIINLEERFIIYRFNDDGKSRLALNPVLAPVLLPFIFDRDILFPAAKENDPAPPVMTYNKKEKIFFDDRILAALLAFVSENELFFTSAGTVRRKILNTAKIIFPGFQLELFSGGLRLLGLFMADGEKLFPDYGRFAAFSELSRQERLEYCTAGIACYSRFAVSVSGAAKSGGEAPPAELSPWLYRTRVRNFASLIHRLCLLLESGRVYTQAALARHEFILTRKTAEGPCGGLLLQAMELTGLLVPAAGGFTLTAPPVENAAGDAAVIAMDAPFSITVYPEISFKDAVELAAFSQIAEAGASVRFEINRDSAVTAFDRGISAGAITELLINLSQNRIDENIIFTLNDWEKRRGEVTLRSGLVLTLAPEHQYLSQTKPFAGLITETLAPGIYILGGVEEETALNFLHRAGISVVGRRNNRRNSSSGLGRGRPDVISGFYPSLQSAALITEDKHFPSISPGPVKTSANTSASDLVNNFHSLLEQMPLGKEEREELAARINRHLIVSESQLQGAVVRYEKLEAGGLDYNGKLQIAKQAIASGALLEIIWPGREQQERLFGVPLSLEKSSSENILVVAPPENKENAVRVPLGKISLLRRIKKSIFENRNS